MKIHIAPNDKGNPPGKLADVELHFSEILLPESVDESLSLTPEGKELLTRLDAVNTLAGTKLIGFAVWERTRGGRERNVTFPARQYTVNGERRSFALLRPVGDFTDTAKIREAVLAAYTEWETANVKA